MEGEGAQGKRKRKRKGQGYRGELTKPGDVREWWRFAWSGKNPDAGRHRDFERCACRGEFAAFPVDAEDGEVVARHVRAEEPFSVGGDEEILRSLAKAGDDVDAREGTVFTSLETIQHNSDNL